jgi:hypothetical protein
VAEAALLIALLLHRPPGLVAIVYDVAGLSGVCVVEYESNFCVTAWRREAEGTSWGLWQLYSKCHPQYRDDLLLHLAYGAEFWKACLEKSCRVSVQGGRTGRQTDTVRVAGGAVRFGALPLGAYGSSNAGRGSRVPAEGSSAPSIAVGYSIWNSGSPTRSIEKGKAVQRKYDSYAMYIYRHLR